MSMSMRVTMSMRMACVPMRAFRGAFQVGNYKCPGRRASACDKKERALRLLKHRRCDFAERQRLSGTPADSHHDEVLPAAMRLLENRVRSAGVRAHCRAHAHAILISDPHDILQDRLLLAPPGAQHGHGRGAP